MAQAYRAVGCHVYSLSQGFRPGGKRHGTTRQTKGLADLWIFCPQKRLAWWHEVKRPKTPTGRYVHEQTPEQRLFETRCQECAVGYVLGGVDAALAHLREIGVVATQ